VRNPSWLLGVSPPSEPSGSQITNEERAQDRALFDRRDLYRDRRHNLDQIAFVEMLKPAFPPSPPGRRIASRRLAEAGVSLDEIAGDLGRTIRDFLVAAPTSAFPKFGTLKRYPRFLDSLIRRGIVERLGLVDGEWSYRLTSFGVALKAEVINRMGEEGPR